jgi:hypothetical protein
MMSAKIREVPVDHARTVEAFNRAYRESEAQAAKKLVEIYTEPRSLFSPTFHGIGEYGAKRVAPLLLEELNSKDQ